MLFKSSSHSERNIKKEEIESEQDTVRLFISGDERAFNKIFDQYHHGLYRHVLRFVKSPDLAADLTQDIFIKLWENRSCIKPEFSFGAYLFTVSKNHLLNTLKKVSREEALKKEIFAYAIDSSENNEESLILADYEQFAMQAISQLPPQRKLVFKMHQEDGKDYHEIAALLGISKNTVRDHLTKATKFVRGYLRMYIGINGLFIILF